MAGPEVQHCEFGRNGHLFLDDDLCNHRLADVDYAGMAIHDVSVDRDCRTRSARHVPGDYRRPGGRPIRADEFADGRSGVLGQRQIAADFCDALGVPELFAVADYLGRQLAGRNSLVPRSHSRWMGRSGPVPGDIPFRGPIHHPALTILKEGSAQACVGRRMDDFYARGGFDLGVSAVFQPRARETGSLDVRGSSSFHGWTLADVVPWQLREASGDRVVRPAPGGYLRRET